MPQISYPNKQLILNYNVEVWFDEVNRCDETDEVIKLFLFLFRLTLAWKSTPLLFRVS